MVAGQIIIVLSLSKQNHKPAVALQRASNQCFRVISLIVPGWLNTVSTQEYKSSLSQGMDTPTWYTETDPTDKEKFSFSCPEQVFTATTAQEIAHYRAFNQHFRVSGILPVLTIRATHTTGVWYTRSIKELNLQVVRTVLPAGNYYSSCKVVSC